MPTGPLKLDTDLKILLIEDLPQMLNLLRSILRTLGFNNVVTATNVENAAAQYKQGFGNGAVDLIICDWELPGVSGAEFLREIRSKHPDLPFLMVTGNRSEEAVLEEKIAGHVCANRLAPQENQSKLAGC
jgi:CheY-like chemotaxis protein